MKIDINDPYFSLKLIIDYGAVTSKIFGIVAMLISGFLFWNIAGWTVIIIAPLIGTLVFILSKSYVEIVNIVFHMLN